MPGEQAESERRVARAVQLPIGEEVRGAEQNQPPGRGRRCGPAGVEHRELGRAGWVAIAQSQLHVTEIAVAGPGKGATPADRGAACRRRLGHRATRVGLAARRLPVGYDDAHVERV